MTVNDLNYKCLKKGLDKNNGVYSFAFSGNDGNGNLRKLFKQLNKNDPPLLIRLDKESHLEPGQHKYIHNDIHNELIEFMEFMTK